MIHSIFTRLNQTFITPFDPEDIHNISSALDNVLDSIEDTAHQRIGKPFAFAGAGAAPYLGLII